MAVGKICTREVHLASPHETVTAAAERMATKNVGCLVILSESQRPVGIITDRDITVKVTGKQKDAQYTTVKDVMTAHPRVIPDDTAIEDAISIMRNGGVRRLPIVDSEGYLVGLLTLDDVMELLLEEFANIHELLKIQSSQMRTVL